MHRRRRTALLLSAAIAAAAPLLTACGSDAHPGAAAVVGGQKITVSQLESRVNEVRAAQREAAGDQANYARVVSGTGTLTRQTLHSMVLDQVLQRAAQDEGVTVSRRDVQQLRANVEQQLGGARNLEATWLREYGIPPQRVDDNLRLQAEAQKLASKLGTTTDQPAFWQALSKASKELGVDINPRYGTWDAQKVGRVDTKTPWIREVSETSQQPT